MMINSKLEIRNTKQIRNSKYRIRNVSNFRLLISNLFRISILVFSILFLVGCSRTVTPLVVYGDQMLVEVTLRGTMDPNNNRYFMVISSDPNYKEPLPPPDQLDAAPEFIEPGSTPQTGSEAAYYNNFFNTWSGYVFVDPLGYNLVKGPFVINQTPTREVLSTFTAISNKLNFSFRLDQLFTTAPDEIYFDIVSVPWPDGAEKVPADHLPSLDNTISRISGSITQVDDDQNLSLDPALDIINCRVEIQ